MVKFHNVKTSHNEHCCGYVLFKFDHKLCKYLKAELSSYYTCLFSDVDLISADSESTSMVG